MHAKCIRWVAAVAFVLTAMTTNAGSISLIPTSAITNVATGDVVSFDVVMDFSDELTLGGGFDVVFDSQSVQFESFYRNPDLGVPEFGRDPDIFEGLLESWAVADPFILPAVATIGNIVFTVLPGMGQSTAIATQATNGVGGPWISAVDFRGLVLDVNYGSATITQVPLPAAFWFLLCGVFVLLRQSCRR